MMLVSLCLGTKQTQPWLSQMKNKILFALSNIIYVLSFFKARAKNICENEDQDLARFDGVLNV